MTASAAGLFQLFRPRLRGLLVVALLVSLSTASSLVEPWIYRAIIDDIAGVFVAPDPLEYADHAMEDVARSLRHLPGSFGRMFNAPLQKFSGAADERRALEARTPQQTIATVLVGALLLVLVRLVSEWCALRGDIRATAEANSVERAFILRTFRHVTALPLSYFSLRSSQAVARRVDQADEISPIVMAVSKEIWPDAFSLVVILGILVSVNWELALVSLVAVPVYGLVTWRMSRALDADIDRYYALWDKVSSRIQQAIAGIKTVQAYGAAEYEVSRLSRVRRGVRHLPATNPAPEPVRVRAERHHRRLEGERARVGRHQGARTPADTGRCRAIPRVPRSRLCPNRTIDRALHDAAAEPGLRAARAASAGRGPRAPICRRSRRAADWSNSTTWVLPTTIVSRCSSTSVSASSRASMSP